MGSSMEYHHKAVEPLTTIISRRKSGSLSLGIHLIMLLCLSLAATTYPLIVEIDPWHGHVVIGGSNRADQTLALLDHRHSHPAGHPASGTDPKAESQILSIAERVMLSTLVSFASEAAVVPTFAFPVLMIFLSIMAVGLLLPEYKIASLAPPSPPPRALS